MAESKRMRRLLERLGADPNQSVSKALGSGSASGAGARLEVTSEGVRVNGEPIQTKTPPELHADDKAIILTLAGSAFCAGLFGFYEGYPILGSFFIGASLLVIAPTSPFVRSRARWLAGRPALWGLGVCTWLFLTIDIGLKFWPLNATPAPVATTQSSVDHAFAPFAVVGGPYLPEEVSRMILALDQVSDTLGSKGAVIGEVRNDLSDWQSKLQHDSAAYSVKLFQDQNALSDLNVSISKELAATGGLQDELAPTLDIQQQGPLMRELYYFGTDIRNTANVADAARASILANDFQRTQEALDTFTAWYNQTMNYTPQKIANLRAYKLPSAK